MQAYINQLLEDMAAARRPEQERPQQTQPISLEQHLEEVERWLAGEEPEHSFSYYCGLERQQFPPQEKLTDEQLQAICKSFRQLLFSWNLAVELPDLMPARMAYPFIISILNEKVQIVRGGIMGIEFCTCDPPSCPFNEYCTCTQYLTETDEKSNPSKKG